MEKNYIPDNVFQYRLGKDVPIKPKSNVDLNICLIFPTFAGEI